MKKLIFIVIVALTTNSTFSQSEINYIEKILKNLNEIQTAEYYTQTTMKDVRNAVPVRTINRYAKIFTNPADSLFGARYILSFSKYSASYDMCYDGRYFVDFEWKDKIAHIDTLTNKSSPGLIAPFFIRARSLLDYTITHKNNVKITHDDFEDSARIKLYIPEKTAYFTRLTPLIIHSPNKFSRYVLWINKANNLPYKLIRNLPDQQYSEECSDLKIDKETNRDFDAIQKIPEDFSILSAAEKQKKRRKISQY